MGFRDWIEYTYPEDADLLFDRDHELGLRLSKAAGALHNRHAEEYLAYLADPGLRPAEVLERLASALGEAGPAFQGLTPAGFATGFEGGEHFLEAQLELQMRPRFSDCRQMEWAILPIMAS